MTEGDNGSGEDHEAGRFTSVLAVCDGGQGDAVTLSLAADIVRDSGGRIMIMGLVEPPSDLARLARHAGLDPQQAVDRLIAEEHQRLLAMASGLSVPHEIEVCSGKPFLEIIRDVIAGSRDLVIKAAEAWAGAPRSLFTSTDQHLLRKCPAPVWLHMPDMAKPARSVLAAVDVDLDAASQPETLSALNTHVVETAAKMAQLTGATLHVLHAWSAPAVGMMWMWSNSPDPKQEVDAYLQSVLDQSRTNLDQLTRGLSVPSRFLQAHSERGDARDIIPRKVNELGIDILVMGSVARTGVPGLIIGNTAEDVLNRVDCSVVIVKPPGYVSPIKT